MINAQNDIPINRYKANRIRKIYSTPEQLSQIIFNKNKKGLRELLSKLLFANVNNAIPKIPMNIPVKVFFSKSSPRKPEVKIML